MAIKLIKANAMLYKTRNFVNKGILKSIYFDLFDSHINYASKIWGQNINTINLSSCSKGKQSGQSILKKDVLTLISCLKILTSSNFLTESKLLTVY